MYVSDFGKVYFNVTWLHRLILIHVTLILSSCFISKAFDLIRFFGFPVNVFFNLEPFCLFVLLSEPLFQYVVMNINEFHLN